MRSGGADACDSRPRPIPMTRIDFYSNAESKLQAACQLVARRVREQRSQVIIYAPDENTARSVDKLLWTLQATGFIPHCMQP